MSHETPKNEKSPRYGLRRTVAAGAALLTLAGLDVIAHGALKVEQAVAQSVQTSESGPAPLTKQQIGELPKVYTAKPGDTIWSIASAQGKAVADNPERLYEAENQLTAQLPTRTDRESSIVISGEQFHLPQSSEIGSVPK